MCGRYTLSVGHEALARAFLAEFAEEVKASWQSRYNIAPGGGITAILEDRDKKRRRAEILHWGLVPAWADDPNIGYKLINARAETVATKPSFRNPFRYRRCLVPASGFFEWDRQQKPRQPYFFHPREADFLAFAGVWEHWQHPDGSEILSAAVLTTAADEVMAPIHHRMPVILPESAWALWLDTGNVKAQMPVFLEAHAEAPPLACHPVSSAVNKATVDGPELIEPVDPVEDASPPARQRDQMELF